MPPRDAIPPVPLLLDTADAGSARAKALTFVSEGARSLLRYVERIARSDAPVLVTGETGTGKELIARHVHRLSGRSGAFVAVNCGAISESLAESELFGHEAGAFTGATARREGWFEAARGGTLFLDELGDLPLPLQVKLLRVLQEREVVRVGARTPIPVDVRLVAATNIDLGEAVRAGRFRLDLYYRLNVAPVRLPPLRERTGDILPLAEHFLKVYAQRLGLPLPALSARARAALQRHAWPGNIRELENIIHHALLVVSDDEIDVDHLRLIGLSPMQADADSPLHAPQAHIAAALRRWLQAPGDGLLHEFEHILVDEAFRHAGYNQVRAAQVLGISRNVLRTLLKKHGHLADDATQGRLAAG